MTYTACQWMTLLIIELLQIVIAVLMLMIKTGWTFKEGFVKNMFGYIGV